MAVPEDDGPSPNDVRRALGRLPFDQRAALIMRELEGRSYTELAVILGVTLGDVETLLFRARRALREELEGALTCHQAERAISRRLDGLLGRADVVSFAATSAAAATARDSRTASSLNAPPSGRSPTCRCPSRSFRSSPNPATKRVSGRA